MPCPQGFYCGLGTASSVSVLGNFSTPQPCQQGWEMIFTSIRFFWHVNKVVCRLSLQFSIRNIPGARSLSCWLSLSPGMFWFMQFKHFFGCRIVIGNSVCFSAQVCIMCN
jgi:hypothetical protein